MDGSREQRNKRASNPEAEQPETSAEQGDEPLPWEAQQQGGTAPFRTTSQQQAYAALGDGTAPVYQGYDAPSSQQFQVSNGSWGGPSQSVAPLQQGRSAATNGSSAASASAMSSISMGSLHTSSQQSLLQQAATISAIQSLLAPQMPTTVGNTNHPNLIQQPRMMHQTGNPEIAQGGSQQAPIDMNHPFIVSLLRLIQQSGLVRGRSPVPAPLPAPQPTPSPQPDSPPALDEARLALLLSQIEQAQQGSEQRHFQESVPRAKPDSPPALDEARLALLLSHLEAHVRSQPPSPPDGDPKNGPSLEPLRTFPSTGSHGILPAAAVLSDTGRSAHMAPSPATVSSTGGEPSTGLPPERKKRRYSHESFPQKLYRLLMEAEQEGNDAIISFGIDGTSFQVHQPEPFETQILPRYFRHNKYASFLRQLLLYGFERVSSGPDKGCHRNPYFIKSRPDLLNRIVRDDKYDKTGKKPAK